MGLFSKPEVIVLKESSDAKLYLEQLEELLPNVQGELKDKIQSEIAVTRAGIFGEDNILFELKNSNMDMVVLHDIYIETKDGLGAQIDFAVVTSKVTFIIECKNLFGNIEIDSKGNFVRTLEYGGRKHKEGLYSPITQNERHMAVLKECRAEEKNIIMAAALRSTFEHFYKSLVVLANPKTVVNDRYAKKEIKEQVLRADQLITVMKKMVSESKELSSSKKEMMVIAEKLLARNREDRKNYFAKYEELAKASQNIKTEETAKDESEQQEAVEKKETLLCPKCGSKMVLRTAKKGANIGQQFYGCSNFPKCRFIMNVEK